MNVQSSFQFLGSHFTKSVASVYMSIRIHLGTLNVKVIKSRVRSTWWDGSGIGGGRGGGVGRYGVQYGMVSLDGGLLPCR